MPALEPLRGVRMVAEPKALDGARWTAATTVLRLAPDEAFAIDAREVDVDDPDAIVVEEHGFVGAWCSLADLGHHVDWRVPDVGPVLAQGAVAGVPVKLWIAGDSEPILLVTAAPYAHELAERLGWTS